LIFSYISKSQSILVIFVILIPNCFKFQPSFAISFNIHIFGNNLNYNLKHIFNKFVSQSVSQSVTDMGRL